MSAAETPEQRHSRAHEAFLITDPDELARAEARNGLRQFDMAIGAVQAAIDRRSFKLRPSLVLALHREALRGISTFAGNYRPAGVSIEGSKHQPPGAHLVPELVEEMCDYVNEKWIEGNALHLAAYLMWRLNWIHPFADGNGRTSRITSYVVLCAKLDAILPGTPTIPDQIVANRKPYFDALDAADTAWAGTGLVDVSMMEQLLDGMLGRQLASVYHRAGGRSSV
jgi:fido (protein-threonine AMPylation protein)